jgi:hypothetical protein
METYGLDVSPEISIEAELAATRIFCERRDDGAGGEYRSQDRFIRRGAAAARERDTAFTGR